MIAVGPHANITLQKAQQFLSPYGFPRSFNEKRTAPARSDNLINLLEEILRQMSTSLFILILNCRVPSNCIMCMCYTALDFREPPKAGDWAHPRA